MRRSLAAVLAVVLALAACGGGDDDAGDGGQAGTVTVEMTDFAYEPAEVSVAAGSSVTLDLQNRGSLVHQWVVLAEGTEVTSEDEFPGETETLDWENTYFGRQLDAGQGATFSFTAPGSGTYQIVCAIDGHLTAGMVGELTVD